MRSPQILTVSTVSHLTILVSTLLWKAASGLLQGSASVRCVRETVLLLLRKHYNHIGRSVATKQSEPNPCWLPNLRTGAWTCIGYKIPPVSDTSHLRQRLIYTWASIPLSVIDKAVAQWRIRLRAFERQSSFSTSAVTKPAFSELPDHIIGSFHSHDP